MKNKPENIKSDDVNDFIKRAKDTTMDKQDNNIDLSTIILSKPKIFPITIPPMLHKLAAEEAAKQKISLHDYVLLAIKEKFERDNSK